MQKSIVIASLITMTFLLFFWYFVAASFYDVTVAKQEEFTTDGCTLFIDSSWKQCCIRHDKVYWNGGTRNMRLDADRELASCVENESNKIMAQIVYGAVRVGGAPYFAVPWRWGYGWDFGRGYR